ncbi:MAG: antibiotic biosynthesis monooxygenase [Pseudomonadota bacterium]
MSTEYAVIFSAKRGPDDEGYAAAAERMAELSASMPGFLRMDHARGSDGFGITVCYWDSEEAIADWRAHAEHQAVQERGRSDWYENYAVRVVKVVRAYGKDG